MSRKTSETWGRRAENFAALWLQLKGYRILARRHKTRFGEIDLVAKRGQILVAVEVKARRTVTDALAVLTVQNLRRVKQAAQQLPQQFDKQSVCSLRIDAVLIVPGKLPRHVENVLEY